MGDGVSPQHVTVLVAHLSLDFDLWCELKVDTLICSSLGARRPIKGIWCSANAMPHIWKVTFFLTRQTLTRVESSGSRQSWKMSARQNSEKSLPQLTEASHTWALLESVAQTSNLIMKWSTANSTVHVRIIYFGMTQLSFAINPGVLVQTTRCWAPEVMLCFPKNRYVIFGSDSGVAANTFHPWKNNCDMQRCSQWNIVNTIMSLRAERVSKNSDLWHLRTWVMRNRGANGNDVAAGVCPVL